jgi:hypothetical protein
MRMDSDVTLKRALIIHLFILEIGFLALRSFI